MSNSSQTYLSFIINDDYFAVSVDKVLEVVLNEKIVKIPNTSTYVKGIIDFRGEIVPVFDARSKFGFENSAESGDVIIVLEIISGNEKVITGAVVDRVNDVLEFSEDEIRQLPKTEESAQTEYILGVVKREDTFILILNVDKIFSRSEMEPIAEIAQMYKEDDSESEEKESKEEENTKPE